MMRRSMRIAVAIALALPAPVRNVVACEAMDTREFVIDTEIVHDVVGMHDPDKLHSVTFCYLSPPGFTTPPETLPGCELKFKEAVEVVLGDLREVADALTVYKGSSW